MSENKSLIQQLSHCEKYEFDEVVKSYLKEIYKLTNIVFTDGKNDGGIDVKVLDITKAKLQFQLTVQKSSTSAEKNGLRKKILEDVQKAERNFRIYGYSQRLEFFYSYPLTETFIDDVQQTAFVDFGISLVVIDAKRIAGCAHNYPNLYKTILQQSGYNKIILKNSTISEKDKLFYDLVGFGEAADVKLRIVEAFLLQCLFDNGSMEKEELVQLCISKFKSSENTHFYDKMLSRMYSREERLTYNKETKEYSLAEKEREKIAKATQNIEVDENLFYSRVKCVLDNYNEGDNLSEYVNLLYELYINNIQQRIGQQGSCGIEDTNKILNFAIQNLNSEDCAKKLVEDLVKICDENKYIQKNCAGKVFGSTIDIDILQNYANSEKRVFIDTTLALQCCAIITMKQRDIIITIIFCLVLCMISVEKITFVSI